MTIRARKAALPIAVSLFLLGSCSAKPSQPAQSATVKATITLTVDHKQISKKTVKVAKKTTVMTAMKRHFKVEEKKGFIESIDGHRQNAGKKQWWLYNVNGKMAPKGADSTVIKQGDRIDWTLNPSK